MKRVFHSNSLNVTFDDAQFFSIVKKHLKRTSTETGGILCGKYSKDLVEAEITEVYGPTSDSKFGRCSFVRGTRGLSQRLDKLWRKGIYYVGEWHLHPYFSANPSFQDKAQIIQNSNDDNLKCPEPVMIIVGMEREQFIFKVFAVVDSEMIELHEVGGKN